VVPQGFPSRCKTYGISAKPSEAEPIYAQQEVFSSGMVETAASVRLTVLIVFGKQSQQRNNSYDSGLLPISALEK
jgi:hypothetical protein